MTDVSNRTREKTPGKSGRFATEQRRESPIELPAEPKALTSREIEWARSLTGSYYADTSPDYYPTIDKALDMALLLAAPNMNHAFEEGMKGRYERLHVEGLHTHQIESFHKTVRELTPGSKPWKGAVDYYVEWDEVDPKDMAWLDTKLRQVEAEALAEYTEKRRTELTELKVRIDAELASLEG